LPRYVKGVFRGDLRGAELRRRAQLAQKRGRLGDLVEQSEAALPRIE